MGIIVMIEEWRPVVGYEGLYEVSNTGQVRNYRGKLLRPGLNHNGYLKCVLCKKGKTKTIYIHRLVAQVFIPNPDNLPEVNHKDEVKSNNCVENLEWCNRKYNCNYGCAQDKRVKTNIINGRFKYSGQKSVEYNKERTKEYKKKYREKNREEIRETKRKWYEKNKEKIMEKKREYYENNKEKIREYMREYMKKRKNK